MTSTSKFKLRQDLKKFFFPLTIKENGSCQPGQGYDMWPCFDTSYFEKLSSLLLIQGEINSF